MTVFFENFKNVSILDNNWHQHCSPHFRPLMGLEVVPVPTDGGILSSSEKFTVTKYNVLGSKKVCRRINTYINELKTLCIDINNICMDICEEKV